MSENMNHLQGDRNCEKCGMSTSHDHGRGEKHHVMSEPPKAQIDCGLCGFCCMNANDWGRKSYLDGLTRSGGNESQQTKERK